ncbi:LCP family protein [Streptomyces sp. NBC_01465]|uniref:LCP family protein n=1 Tax=Streptomyces sp. NBC_01465 TaxID=2903878 RepID=UPI002E30A8B8|nr:LCP family protein [Streptomyces sp. NBC_01465]
MNDRQNPYVQYDQYGQPMQLVGYDEYGQPVYQSYDPYGQQQPQQPPAPPQQQPQQGYGYDPYAQPQQPQQQQPRSPQQPYQQPGYDAYGQDYGTGQQPAVDTTQQWAAPPQQQPQQQPQRPQQAPPAPQPTVPEQRRPAPGSREYETGQFDFIEEPDEDSEDVIDWLAFTESRSERREEAKRRGRNRVTSLIVVMALLVVGGVGYLWYADKIPGLSGGSKDDKGTTASGAQKRDLIVVDLHDLKSGFTSSLLLVDNVTTQQGSAVLLPNSLMVANDDGTSTTLGKSVDDDGSDGTRESLGTLFGAKIGGTWRLDTPYLENLVEVVGSIEVDTDTDVPGAKKGDQPVVKKGKAQSLSGTMAVAYATYRAPGEAQVAQLQRFGQVMQAVLKKFTSVPSGATVVIKNLNQVLDPSLTDAELGASLAKLAEHAKKGAYKTALLPVQADGTLTEAASSSVVKDILGGAVKAPEKSSTTRVGIKDATGKTGAKESARITVVNGGYAFVDGGKASSVASSQVTYGDAADKAKAEEVAKTLGLSTGAVKKGTVATTADVMVVLGQDYKINTS